MAIAQNQQLTFYQGPNPSKTDSEHFEREVYLECYCSFLRL